MKKLVLTIVLTLVLSANGFAQVSTVQAGHQMMMALLENAILLSGGSTQMLTDGTPEVKSVQAATLYWMNRKSLNRLYLLLYEDSVYYQRAIQLDFTYLKYNGESDILDTPDYGQFRDAYKQLPKLTNCRWKIVAVIDDSDCCGWKEGAMPNLEAFQRISFDRIITSGTFCMAGTIYFKLPIAA